MAVQSPVLQRCFEEAASSSARGLQRGIDEAIASLQNEEAAAVKVVLRDRIALAWNGLLKQRVADELTTTFASHYEREITLRELLTPDALLACARMGTGQKTLLRVAAG